MNRMNRRVERPRRSPTVCGALATGALAAPRAGRGLMVKLRRLLLAPSLTLLASLVLAGTASAAPGDGAQVVNESDCHTFEFGTVCVKNRGVFNETLTPSGNFSVHQHGYWSLEFTGSGPLEGCRSSDSDKYNFHYLVKPGDVLEEGPHEEGSRSHHEISFECFGQTYRCAHTVHFHIANGKVQFSRFEENCTEN